MLAPAVIRQHQTPADSVRRPCKAGIDLANGQAYEVIRRQTNSYDPTCISDHFPGIGVIGSYRKWLGHRHTARPYWYAAINPTGDPSKPPTRPKICPHAVPPPPGYCSTELPHIARRAINLRLDPVNHGQSASSDTRDKRAGGHHYTFRQTFQASHAHRSYGSRVKALTCRGLTTVKSR